MLKELFSALFVLVGSAVAQDTFPTRFETSGGIETASYGEGIEYYRSLQRSFPEVGMLEGGLTDSGYPLHLVLVSGDRDFDFESVRKKGRTILLVVNAIHAGEPDGVDASMMLVRDLVSDPRKHSQVLDRVLLAVIPFYNIGGVLNRGSTSRPNQNGPEEHGFRGNARNYDLNRDFIKGDTRNTRAFAGIFHLLDPDVMADTHVSNGADYQHVMTMVQTQKDKLGGELAAYLEDVMMPHLYQQMERVGFDMVPYVNAFGDKPEEGFPQFFDHARYSSGYAALFSTLSFMSESHMLKPYPDRVRATYALLLSTLDLMARDGSRIRELREQAKEDVRKQQRFPLTWRLDRSQYSAITFKGYEATTVSSQVTSGERLFYDRSKPFEKRIPFYNRYLVELDVEKPEAYLIPQGWHEVIELLGLNGVRALPLPEDREYEVEAYRIEDYESRNAPYEGHYVHDRVEVSASRLRMAFKKGDALVPTDQASNRYIVEALEPQAADSLFRWNFFDTILQRREGYSSYVFEDLAQRLLEEDPALRADFERRRKEDAGFAGNARAQLNFIFQRSPYYEASHLRYPVYRVIRALEPGER